VRPRPVLKATLFAATLLVGAGLVTLSCTLHFDPSANYICAKDSDCGGGAWVCVSSPTGGYCCDPSPEVCDGKDNDCNGLTDDIVSEPCYDGPAGTEGVGPCKGGMSKCVNGALVCDGEVVPLAEVCNGWDDDCDGNTDNGFDFLTDPQNCGHCGVQCAADCVKGICVHGPDAGPSAPDAGEFEPDASAVVQPDAAVAALDAGAHDGGGKPGKDAAQVEPPDAAAAGMDAGVPADAAMPGDAAAIPDDAAMPDDAAAPDTGL